MGVFHGLCEANAGPGWSILLENVGLAGAGRGNRTLTLLPELDFESSASTNSAIPALRARGVTEGRTLPARGGDGIIAKTAADTKWPLRPMSDIPRYRLSDFDYELPPELIAQTPAISLTASRLLHVAR